MGHAPATVADKHGLRLTVMSRKMSASFLYSRILIETWDNHSDQYSSREASARNSSVSSARASRNCLSCSSCSARTSGRLMGALSTPFAFLSIYVSSSNEASGRQGLALATTTLTGVQQERVLVFRCRPHDLAFHILATRMPPIQISPDQLVGELILVRLTYRQM